MLDIRKIRYFVAVYEAGSISKAAEREHIAQPALTVHIQQIEDELGVKLFERSAHGVSATPAAKQLYSLSLDLLKRVDSLGEQMARYSGAVAGAITAGIMPSICHGPLAPMLVRYTTAYPNVTVRIVEALSGTLADWVLSDTVDFALCNQPAATRGLEHRLLINDPLVLVSGRQRALPAFAPLDLLEVAGLKLVLPSRSHSLRHTLEHHINRGDFRPVQTLEIDGQSATLQFVAHSDWSTILPRIALVNEFKSQRFTINPIRQPQLRTEIYALHSAKHTLSEAAQRFILMLEADLHSVPALPLTE